MGSSEKGLNRFLISAASLLFITGLAKVLSGFGNARILHISDPLLGIPFFVLFWLVGLIELAAAIICLFGKRAKLQVGLVAWLTTLFLIYRIGLLWIGYHRPCPCLGNLTDALHISPNIADTGMLVVLAYLLVGSYTFLAIALHDRNSLYVASATPGEAAQ